MKIIVINGSPRTDKSITLQYFHYLAKVFPNNSYTVYNVASEIIRMEKDKKYSESLIKEIGSADLIFQIFPVYTFSIPYCLVKFYEIIDSLPAKDYLRGSITMTLSTSMRFYDHFAHGCVRWYAELWGIDYIEGFSAALDDIFTEEKREQLNGFFKYALASAKSKNFIRNRILKSSQKTGTIPYISTITKEDLPARLPKKVGRFRTVLLKENDSDNSLNQMVNEFIHAFPYPVEIFTLADLKLKGSCMGCAHCFSSGKCIYNDGFDPFYKENILPPDLLIFAQTINNPTASSSWKMFQDRRFYAGHQTPRKGKVTGYIVSGPLSQNSLYKDIVTQQAMVGGESFCGIVSDEESRNVTKSSLIALAGNAARMLELGYKTSPFFPAIGGMKLFRDMVYRSQAIMPKDHKYYKANGLYDFPRKDRKGMFRMRLSALILKFNKKYRSIYDFILEPIQKIIDEAKPIE